MAAGEGAWCADETKVSAYPAMEPSLLHPEKPPRRQGATEGASPIWGAVREYARVRSLAEGRLGGFRAINENLAIMFPGQLIRTDVQWWLA